MRLPSFSIRPLPTAITLPSIGFSFAESGMMIPPFFCSFSSTRLTRTRSYSGCTFMVSNLLLGLSNCVFTDT